MEQRRWHPIMSTVEDPGGTWRLLDGLDAEYGRVEIRRTPDGIRYKASFRGRELGWGMNLLATVDRVHQAFLAAHGPSGGAIADWGELTGNSVRRDVSRARTGPLYQVSGPRERANAQRGPDPSNRPNRLEGCRGCYPTPSPGPHLAGRRVRAGRRTRTRRDREGPPGLEPGRGGGLVRVRDAPSRAGGRITSATPRAPSQIDGELIPCGHGPCRILDGDRHDRRVHRVLGVGMDVAGGGGSDGGGTGDTSDELGICWIASSIIR